jgi:hypothetical protein
MKYCLIYIKKTLCSFLLALLFFFTVNVGLAYAEDCIIRNNPVPAEINSTEFTQDLSVTIEDLDSGYYRLRAMRKRGGSETSDFYINEHHSYPTVEINDDVSRTGTFPIYASWFSSHQDSSSGDGHIELIQVDGPENTSHSGYKCLVKDFTVSTREPSKVPPLDQLSCDITISQENERGESGSGCFEPGPIKYTITGLNSANNAFGPVGKVVGSFAICPYSEDPEKKCDNINFGDDKNISGTRTGTLYIDDRHIHETLDVSVKVATLRRSGEYHTVCTTKGFQIQKGCTDDDTIRPVNPNEKPNSITEEGEPYQLCLKNVPEGMEHICEGCVSDDANVTSIPTAIGCIPTDPTKMVSALIGVGLSISGGAALLMFLAAGFLFSTSQGDPKRTSEAKDLLTSAVVGLLFCIFSVSILQFIGVNILQIPGFGGP